MNDRTAATPRADRPPRRRRTDRVGIRVTNLIVVPVGLALLIPCLAVVAFAGWIGGAADAVGALGCVAIPGGFGSILIAAGAVGYRRAGDVTEGS